MSYTPNVQLDLGPTYTGMSATLRAQLYTGSTGATAGAEISGGFTEMPGDEGQYIFRPSIPDGHDGWGRVYPVGESATVTAGYFAINPVELELNALADAIIRRSRSHSNAAAETGSLYELIGIATQSDTLADSGATLTVYETDGTTPFNTRSLNLDPGAQPVAAIG